MFWLDEDKPSKTATVHRDECVHGVPEGVEHKGINEMLKDGGWFSFGSVGEAMRFHKESRLPGKLVMCSFCTPLGQRSPEPMAKLDIKSIKTGCDLGSEIKVTDTKSQWKRLIENLRGRK